MRSNDRVAQAFGATTASGAAGQRCCQWVGCQEGGVYRAPISPERLTEYWWFCLLHVRAYNAAWNYYAGMSDRQVEADIRRDTVWQRPTWPLGASVGFCGWRAHDVGDGFGVFQGARSPARPEPPTAEDLALLVLDLRPPVTVAILKARYKQLVKRHHPDANGGDKAAEERFKQISEAYRTVLSSLAQ